MGQNSFPYSYWIKILGFGLVLTAVSSFIQKYLRHGVFDPNELAIGASWGLLFIFFSREKTDDEMIQNLKLRALSWAIISAFSATHLYNYLFLNWHYKSGIDTYPSISAHQFLALTLLIATVYFYFLKRQAGTTGKE